MKRIIQFELVFVLMALMVSPVMAEGGSWGAGMGIPYGIMGVNVDFNVIANLDFSAGVGINPLDGDLAYNIGGKLYLAPRDASFRPRLSCYYGTNTVVETSWEDYTSYKGITVGGGAVIYFGQAKQQGIDFDVLYLLSNESDYDNSDDVTGGVKFSVGYRRKF